MVNNTLYCYETAVNPENVWHDKSPLLHALPSLVLQMALAIGSNLVFLYILRPLHQPRIVVDLLSALTISPLGLHFISTELSDVRIWPRRGRINVEMLANMGLLYAMFIKGLQMDLTPVTHRRGRKAITFSIGVITLPFIVGCTIASLFSKYELGQRLQGRAIFVYFGSVVAASCFPTVASILSRLKLLCTEIGRSSLCIAMINDLGSWFFIFVVVALSALAPGGDPEGFSRTPFFVVFIFTVSFWVFCTTAIRPLLLYAIRHNKDGENFSDSTLHVILFMVMAAGLLSEFFGCYAFVGAFLLGLSVPHGFLAQSLADKMEDCVSALLMPLYFVYVGMIMRHAEFDAYAISLNTTLVIVAVLAKPLCIFIVSIICGIPFRDGLAISVLLNAKGLLSVVIATVGFERGHLSSEAVAVLVSIVVVSSMVVEPVMMFAYNRVMKNTKPYDNRTIGGLKPEAEFRVISCIQGPRNLSSTINLLEISNVTHIFALHLTELIGRTSAMLIVHESSKDSGGNGFYNRARAQSDQIITAFDNYQRQHSDSTAVQTLTIVSPMETMHEDICHLAEDKQVNMIMLPFHKQQGMDGNLEDDKNIEIRSVNQNVMAGAPCSISILIDRGIGMLSGPRPSFSATRSNNQSESQEGEVRVAMFYFGGPDDREALSYAGRLASNSNVTLTLIRIVVGSNPVDVEPIVFPGDEEEEEENGIPTVYTEQKQEKDIDNNFIANFLQRNSAESPVQYMEMASNSGADTVAMLKEMEHRNFDLYMVGRGQGVLSPMTSGLIEWSECPELGPIGDVLVTSDFATNVSVLVVQQYAGARLTSPEDAAVIDF